MMENAERFHSDDNLDMYYDAETKIMFFQWKRRTLGDPYRNAFMKGIEHGKTHPTKYFMSDITHQGIVGPNDRKWFEEVAVPGAVKSGVIKVGIIFDGNVFKQYYINNIMLRFKKKAVPMKFFRSKEAAIDWLLIPIGAAV
ncbi:MAG: hypothetical protein MI922_15640 [Bacteroidales bacterium]|nr:hypothetical protein [Bacteroidales bacterium]